MQKASAADFTVAAAGPDKPTTGVNWVRPAVIGVCLLMAAVASSYAYLYVGRTMLDWKINQLLSRRRTAQADYSAGNATKDFVNET